MKYASLLGLILLVALVTTFQQPKTTDDPEELRKVVLNFFDGIREKDFNKLRDATTDDFILYEDGLVWNLDSAVMNIKKHIPFIVKYKLDNFKIHVDQASGDMTYYNQGEFVFKDKKKSINWIESATFRKDTQGWKMNLLHVTARD